MGKAKSSHKVEVFLPARLGSTRFPGKALADVRGKTLLQRCWESVRRNGYDPYIVTSDSLILREADRIGAKSVMTSDNPINGTERVAEAANLLDLDPETIIVNCQADQFGWEDLDFLNTPIEASKRELEGDYVFTVYSPTCNLYDLDSVHAVKVLRSRWNGEIDFSRSIRENWEILGIHFGVYVARKWAFDRYWALDSSEREKDESLEQLRWHLEIKPLPVKGTSWKVDTPGDLSIFLMSGVCCCD